MLCSLPVEEFENLTSPVFETENLLIDAPYDVSELAKTHDATFTIDMEIADVTGFELRLSNKSGLELSLVYDNERNQFTVDRSKSGDVSFHPEFGNQIIAPRFSTDTFMKLKLVVDVTSMEVFADDGSTVFTVIFFPDTPLDHMEIVPKTTLSLSKLRLEDIDL